MKNSSSSKFSTKKLTILAIFAALSYVSSTLIRIPIGTFLTYDIKDVFLAICGFLYGPSLLVPTIGIVSFLEMATVSSTGFVGALAAFLSSSAFVLVSSAVYKYKRTLLGAVIGLISGTIALTLVMLLWNLFITPLYLGIPLEGIKEILLPFILPFNIIKGTLNSAIIMLIYKPLVKTLSRVGLLEKESTAFKLNKKTVTVILFSSLIIATCIVTLIMALY